MGTGSGRIKDMVAPGLLLELMHFQTNFAFRGNLFSPCRLEGLELDYYMRSNFMPFSGKS